MIFLEFNLPNATTWFYFSFLLAVALFFKFSRLLSVRNWDVVTVFLLVPGLLLLQDARPSSAAPEKHPAVAAASLVAATAANSAALPVAGLGGVGALSRTPELAPTNALWFGYLWLLCGSAYFLLRCLLDLVLVRRPALSPNLNFGGLAWLGGALFICLATVAFRHGDRTGSTPVALDQVAASGDAAKVGKEPVSVQAALRPLPPWLMRTLALL